MLFLYCKKRGEESRNFSSNWVIIKIRGYGVWFNKMNCIMRCFCFLFCIIFE